MQLGSKANHGIDRFRGGEHELYDLDEDPYDTKNLATAGYEDRIEDLLDEISGWQMRTRNRIHLPRVCTSDWPSYRDVALGETERVTV